MGLSGEGSASVPELQRVVPRRSRAAAPLLLGGASLALLALFSGATARGPEPRPLAADAQTIPLASSGGGAPNSSSLAASSRSASERVSAPDGPSPRPPRLLDAVSLGRAIRADRASLRGHYLLVRGTLVASKTHTTTSCFDGHATCPRILLQDLAPALAVEPTGDIGPGPWEESRRPIAGAFALRLTDDDVLEMRGALALPPSGGREESTAAWSVAELVRDGPKEVTPLLFVVTGWLGGEHSEPPTVCPSPALEQRTRCGDAAWLTEEPFTATPDSPFPPSPAIQLQPGAYGEYARDPARRGGSSEPRFGTYLLWFTNVACSGSEDCFPRLGWVASGRVEAVP